MHVSPVVLILALVLALLCVLLDVSDLSPNRTHYVWAVGFGVSFSVLGMTVYDVSMWTMWFIHRSY